MPAYLCPFLPASGCSGSEQVDAERSGALRQAARGAGICTRDMLKFCGRDRFRIPYRSSHRYASISLPTCVLLTYRHLSRLPGPPADSSGPKPALFASLRPPVSATDGLPIAKPSRLQSDAVRVRFLSPRKKLVLRCERHPS